MPYLLLNSNHTDEQGTLNTLVDDEKCTEWLLFQNSRFEDFCAGTW
jgi:hypothetical protein